MSVNKNYYVIAGYDLTGWDTDKFKDWKWTDEGERYTCYQTKGEIQLFDDPMCGEHLYLGYVLASGDEYEFETTVFDLADVEAKFGTVRSEFTKLQEIGVISKDPQFKPEIKIIAFEECT